MSEPPGDPGPAWMGGCQSLQERLAQAIRREAPLHVCNDKQCGALAFQLRALSTAHQPVAILLRRMFLYLI